MEKQPTGGSKYKDSSFLDSRKFCQPIRMLLRPKLMKIIFLFFFLGGGGLRKGPFAVTNDVDLGLVSVGR